MQDKLIIWHDNNNQSMLRTSKLFYTFICEVITNTEQDEAIIK